MQEELNEENPTTDETLLLISGSKGSKEADKDYAKKISGAVISCISKYELAKLRCVGAASLNNAIKGIAIAKNNLIDNGDKIFISPSFKMVHFGEDERTGILFEVIKINSYEADGNLNRTDAILKVRGSSGDKKQDKEYVKKLSNAILSCFEKQGTALLRYVGAASGNNAIKAATIAIGEASKRGKNLIIDPSFTIVNFGEDEKTGMILEIVKIPE